MSRILIVEDNETMREGMVLALNRNGHHVDSAASGNDGLELFREQPYDLVITDYRMDGMNGIELLKEIRELNEDIDVVVITAYGTWRWRWTPSGPAPPIT